MFEANDLEVAFEKLREAGLNPEWPRGRHDNSEEYTVNYSQIQLQIHIFLCPECWSEIPKQRRQTFHYRVVDGSIEWFKCVRGHETVSPIIRPLVEVLVSKHLTEIFFSWEANRNLGDLDLWDSLRLLEKIFPGFILGLSYVKPISAEALLLRKNVVDQWAIIQLYRQERDQVFELITNLVSNLEVNDNEIVGKVAKFLNGYHAIQNNTERELTRIDCNQCASEKNISPLKDEVCASCPAKRRLNTALPDLPIGEDFQEFDETTWESRA